MTRQWTAHFHIKDWIKGAKHGSLAGEGQGRIEDVMTDAVAAKYDGFATLEPHLLGGGPTGGVTGDRATGARGGDDVSRGASEPDSAS